MMRSLPFAISLCAAIAGIALGEEKQPAWELWPYRINVIVAADATEPELAGLEDELPPYLESRAAAVVGGAWQLKAAAASSELRPPLLRSLETLTAKELPQDSLSGDKVMLLTVAKDESGYVVRAREFDAVTGLWNATVTLDVRQPTLVRSSAFQAVLVAFAPQARIDDVNEDVVTMRLRAGAIPRRDRELPAFSPRAVFRPALVASDVSGLLKRGTATAIPRTFLVPLESSGSVVKCRVHTALAGDPIGDYHPLRQRLAVAVAPQNGTTQLRLVTIGDPPQPLAGCEVLASDVGADAAGGPLVRIGKTDRDGKILIPAGAKALRVVVVKQGSAELARVPLVPGLAAQETLEVADPRRQLEIEAALAELEDALTDLLVRRELLAARIKAAEADKSDSVASLRDQLRQLPSPDALLKRLSDQEQAIKAAGETARRQLEPRAAAVRKLADQRKTAGN